MKTSVLTFLFLSLTSVLFSQNEMAYATIEPEHKPSTNKFQKNSEYLAIANVNATSDRIIKFQKLVADYNLSEHPIYAPNDPSVYTMEFTEAKNKISAQYDQNGNILQSSEKYKNIVLPLAISSQICKAYPDWTFKGNTVIFEYSEGEIVKAKYKVFLKKDAKRKVVVID